MAPSARASSRKPGCDQGGMEEGCSPLPSPIKACERTLSPPAVFPEGTEAHRVRMRTRCRNCNRGRHVARTATNGESRARDTQIPRPPTPTTPHARTLQHTPTRIRTQASASVRAPAQQRTLRVSTGQAARPPFGKETPTSANERLSPRRTISGPRFRALLLARLVASSLRSDRAKRFFGTVVPRAALPVTWTQSFGTFSIY